MDAFVNEIIRDADAKGEPSTGVALRCNGAHRSTLVRVAEAAVDYSRPDDAQKALDDFFALAPIHDQYYVRALFAAAELQALRAARFGGHNRLQLILSAIDTLMTGLGIAEKGGTAGDTASCRFLVYNASVHHWGIVRPLLRAGYRRYAAASLQRVAHALALADDSDTVWRVRHHMLIAMCCAEAATEDRSASAAGGSNNSERTVQAALAAAWDLACQAARRAPLDAAAARLVEDVIRLATHLNTTATPGAAAASALTSGDASKTGGAKGSSSAASFTPGQLYGGPAFLALADPRSRLTAALQALWSATAFGCAAGEDPEVAAADSASLMNRARRVRGSDDIRARLVDALHVRCPHGFLLKTSCVGVIGAFPSFLQQLSPAALARYAALTSALNAREILLRQAEVVPSNTQGPRPDGFPAPPEDGEHLALLSLVGRRLGQGLRCPMPRPLIFIHCIEPS
jgi:hypothetical protein